MKKIKTYLSVALVVLVLLPSGVRSQADSIYNELKLEGKLRFEIFQRALEGKEKYDFPKDTLITIIDYTRASHQKRLYVIDLKNVKLVYHTLVAHGKNSGIHFAEKFSNRNRSLMSSPGFYRTSETYHGKHGYSLRLDGLEKGINDKARDRLIVIHGAHYVSQDFIDKHGRIGRSWGCPALPPQMTAISRC